MPPVFASYSRTTLQAARRNLLFCVAVSERLVLALLSFLMSALFGVPSELRKAFLDGVDPLLEGVSFLFIFMSANMFIQ